MQSTIYNNSEMLTGKLLGIRSQIHIFQGVLRIFRSLPVIAHFLYW